MPLVYGIVAQIYEKFGRALQTFTNSDRLLNLEILGTSPRTAIAIGGRSSF
ncbi:MAG: hypothetical protein QW406_06070 [Ignisphaera sp.]